MNIAQSIDQSSAVAVNKLGRNVPYTFVYGALRIHITQGGYRELRSPAEMRKLLNREMVDQDRKCAICHEDFRDYNDVVPDHRDPKGMGGAWRVDHPMSKQRIGGATGKKVRAELTTEGRSVGFFPSQPRFSSSLMIAKGIEAANAIQETGKSQPYNAAAPEEPMTSLMKLTVSTSIRFV